MTIGVVGRKTGMTRIFTEDGASVPVTVIEVSPNRITQIRDAEKDGYRAVQVTTGERRARRVTKRKPAISPRQGPYRVGVCGSSAWRMAKGQILRRGPSWT